MAFLIETYRLLEDKLVHEMVDKYLLANDKCVESLTNKDLSAIYKSIHEYMVCSLINYYLSNKCYQYAPHYYSCYFEGDNNIIDFIPDNLDVDDVPILCEELHVLYLNSIYSIKNNIIRRIKSKDNLIENGAVYTQDEIAYSIVKRTLNNIHSEAPRTLKFLDFATGTGRFYRQLVKCIKERWNIEPQDSISNNIYAIDIDPVAINICRLNALSLFGKITLDVLDVVSRHIICKNALIREELFDNQAVNKEDCDGLFFSGFDAIVSNPPYLVLKPNKRKMDQETVDSINAMARYFRSSNAYKYSIEGMLNLYQLSLETMVGMLKPNGEMGIICPSTLFADVSASALRKYLLSKHNVSYIRFFSEDDPLFDNVTQATCIFHLTKNKECKYIDIVQGNKSYKIELDDVKQVFSSNWEIPSIEKVEWNILRKLLSIPKLKKYKNIRNKRGELDLSLYKDYITTEPTSLRLVRGNMISGNSLIDVNHEYVKPEFFEKKSQDYLAFDKGRKRLICQQISNMTQRVRLRFVECENNDVLGNSCNYITIDEDKIPQMKALLNSAILNWRFKITSTNNHINNYELDELPLIDLESISDDIIGMDERNRNKKICALYGLKEEEIKFIISQHYDTI